MNRIVKTTFKIGILFLFFLVPVSLFMAFFSLSQRNIPLWNIGIRNILMYARINYLPALFTSYFVATLLAISLIDKMRVRSILSLYLPAFIVGFLFFGAVSFLEGQKKELSLFDRTLHLGYGTFLKEGVFNDLKSGFFLLKKKDKDRYTIYIYDRSKNSLSIIHNVSTKKGSAHSLFVDQNKRAIIIRYEEGKKTRSIQFPYSAFPQGKDITKNRLISEYAKRVKKTLSSVMEQSNKLRIGESSLFFASMLVALLMISLPLTYALNDGGWGFSGIIGVILILIVLPLFYGYVFSILNRLRLNTAFLKKYYYLIPSILFGAFGIFLTILIKVMGRKTRRIKRGIEQ